MFWKLKTWNYLIELEQMSKVNYWTQERILIIEKHERKQFNGIKWIG